MRTAELPRVVVASLVGLAAIGAANGAPRGPQGDDYASIAKLPDWSGLWIVPESSFVQSLLTELDPRSPSAPALTPAYLATLVAFNTRRMTGADPAGSAPLRLNSERCLPPGMPDVMRYPAAIEWLFTPGRVTLLSEEGPTVRRIYTDGRVHRKDAEPSFTGESVGHWEGETLVVDTTAISPRAQLIGATTTSGRAHIVERVHLKDPTHLEIATIVEDPLALRTPWQYSRIYERLPNADFREYVCLENDRDRGGAEPDLTPPDQRR